MPHINEVLELERYMASYMKSHGWTMKESRGFAQAYANTCVSFVDEGKEWSEVGPPSEPNPHRTTADTDFMDHNGNPRGKW